MSTQQILTSDISQPLVSFIVTTYNLPADYLKECLESILQLSLNPKEREIILIDDGSNQCALDELTDIRDSIIYIRQCNQGLSMARNRGLQMATGKFIQFVDGDDYLIHAPYEHCLDIARYHNPDIVYFEETDTTEVDTPFNYSDPVSGNVFLHDNNLHASACSYIFKYSLLLNLRFTPGILHEDEEFTPQLFLRADRIITTKSKAYFYREHSNSITHSDNKPHKMRRLADTEQIIFRLQDIASTLPSTDRVALNRRIAQLTMDHIYNTIIWTRSRRHLEKTIKRLHARGLFPLPEKNYTKKYHAFRKVINSKAGRMLLILTLPRLKSK